MTEAPMTRYRLRELARTWRIVGSCYTIAILAVVVYAIVDLTPDLIEVETAVALGAGAFAWLILAILPFFMISQVMQAIVVVLPEDGMSGAAGEWRADPTGRYPDRWWDGSSWTKWVRDKPGGTRSEDHLGAQRAASGRRDAVQAPVATEELPPTAQVEASRRDTGSGWLPDPTGRSYERWWDGEKFTAKVRNVLRVVFDDSDWYQDPSSPEGRAAESITQREQQRDPESR